MLEEARVYIARRGIPANQRFDVTIAETVELEAPVLDFDVEFRLSSPYALTIGWEHDDPDLELEPYLWRAAGLETLHRGLEPIYWLGVIESIRYRGRRGEVHAYELTLRPSLHHLSYGRDTRIFQDKSVPEIVAAVIGASGQPVEWHLEARYPTLEYVVQREESDLDFVFRLLADEGITFWFRHRSDAHVMHLADERGAYLAREAPLRATYSSLGDPGELAELEMTTQVVHDLHTTRDWNWLQPAAPIEAEHADGDTRRFERYEYPGRFTDEADARRLARRRQEADSCRRWELTARGFTPHLETAQTFTLVDARPDELNDEYLITSVAHRFARYGGEGATEQPRAAVSIRAGLASEGFRPRRDVSRPRVSGRDTAFVSGPAGEEIFVDEFGRVKTAFYWDRLGRADHTASTWVRSIQPNTVGSMFLPRMGWEVAVAHLNGDPDRPLVTHKLFNAQEMSTYPLPESLPQTSWQSSSSPGGGGSNELRMDDTLGAMELYVHAERDLHTTVGHDREATVGANSTERVRGSLRTSVGQHETVTVGVDESVEVRQDLRLTTGGTKTVRVAQLDAWDVRRNHTITVSGDRELTVVGPMVMVARAATETLSGNRDRTVGGALIRRTGRSFVEAVGGSKEETVSGARVLLVRRTYGEQVEGSKSLEAGAGAIRTAGPIALSGQNLDVSVSGTLTENVVGTAGVSGASVVVRGNDELRAAAGGNELLLGGDVLDLDASAFSSTAAVVRLQGQVDVIAADGADEAEPEEPSPEDDWVEVTLTDANGEPHANEAYVLQLADGTERSGNLDSNGYVREEGLPPGTVLISFPELESTESDETDSEPENSDADAETDETQDSAASSPSANDQPSPEAAR